MRHNASSRHFAREFASRMVREDAQGGADCRKIRHDDRKSFGIPDMSFPFDEPAILHCYNA